MLIIINTEKAKKLLKGYSMKAVKSIPGHDGDVLMGNLYFNNRLVARIANDCWGGDMNVDIKNDVQYKMFTQTCNDFKSGKYKIIINEELVLNEMMYQYQEDKRLKALCRTKMVVITTGCNDDEVITYNRKYDPSEPVNHRKQLKAKYGKSLVEIVNDRYL